MITIISLLLIGVVIYFWRRYRVRAHPCEKQPSEASAGKPPSIQREWPTQEEREIGRKHYGDLIAILGQNPYTKWEELDFQDRFWDLLREDECAQILWLANDDSIIRPALRQGTTGMVKPKNAESFLENVPEGEDKATSRILAKVTRYFASESTSCRDEFCHWSFLYQDACGETRNRKLPNTAVIREYCSASIMKIAERNHDDWFLAETILYLPNDCPEQRQLAEKLAREERHFSLWYELTLKLRAQTRRDDSWFLKLAEGMVKELDQTFESALERLRKSKYESASVEQLLHNAMFRITTTGEAVRLLNELDHRNEIPAYWKLKVQRIAVYRVRSIDDWMEIPWADWSKDHQLQSLTRCHGSFEEWYRLASEINFTYLRFRTIPFDKAAQQAETLEQWIRLYHLSQRWDCKLSRFPPADNTLNKIRTCPTTHEEIRMEFLKNQSYPELAAVLSARLERQSI